MKHSRTSKSLVTLFIMVLFLTSSFAAANPANANGNFAGPTANGNLGKDGYSLSWEPNSQSNLADNQAFVELVIGVGEKANSLAGLSDLVSRSGGKIVNTVSLGEKQAVVVSVPTTYASTLAAEAHSSGDATYVEPNKLYQAYVTPNDHHWSLQWGPQKIQADYAWNTTTGNSTVLVAVVDTGIDYNHPDLAANYVPLGYNWVEDSPIPLDDHGHGTHCAGIIAAAFNNTIGVAGLAQVRIMAEKALNVNGSGWSDDLANAIIHATDQGAKIISNSWGSNESSSLIHDAIVYANSHGVLVLAAAGNGGSNEPEYPGAQEEAVCVSATDATDTPASFTTYGDWVDVAAPGVSIYSTMPTYHVTMNDREYSMNYAYMSGTSMATPMAAGVAALIWSRFPYMTADLVRYQLETTCDDLGSAGFDIYYGNGRVNAKKAVEQIPADDLLISSWNPPNQFLKINNQANFEATVFNRGLNTKTQVQVQLLANGSVINSTTITTIPPGGSANPQLSWKPTAAGHYNITLYVIPKPEENITANNVVSKNFIVGVPPSETNWTLVATDPDEGQGLNLKSASTQLQSNVVYFKVAFHFSWVNASSDIDAAILVDTDRNPRTGLPDHYYANQNSDIGADAIIIVGNEGPEMWRWNTTINFFDSTHPLSLSYLDAPDGSSQFVVGVKATDLETTGVFDFAVADVYSDWDWMPNSGNRPFIQDKASHELAVTLFNAVGIKPGTAAALNATVYNFGTSSETNVNLHILINGTQVKSAKATQLGIGSSYSTVYTWTPNAEAIYNITAYAQPLSNEGNLLNNAKTILVPVFPKIALISDNYELDYVAPTLDAMWINYDSYYYNYYYLYTQNLTLLNGYRTVIFFNSDRNISAAEQSALNAFLAAGGNLLVTGYDSLGDPDDPRLANVVRSSTVGDDFNEPDLYVVNSTHPIMNGPYGAFPAGYHISGLYEDNDAAEADTARNAATIAQLADGKDKIIATQSLPGKVVYWNGDGRFDWMDNASCTAMLKNMLLWFVDVSAPQTTNNYNGEWHTADFTVNLVADDYFGVNQTYYKINNGSTRTLSANGQPQITTESANNTLEYWSVDLLGNQETHHFLMQIKLDKTSPTGSIKVNNGEPYTTSANVTLTLTAADAVSGVNQLRYSNDAVWDTEHWETPTISKAWTLPPGDGAKTVYLQIKNTAGLMSDTYSDTITLDTTAPAASIQINSGANYTTSSTVTLTVTYTDTVSGVSQVRFSNDGLWDNAQWENAVATKIWTLISGDGAKSVYCQIKDNAGLSTTVSATIILDTQPPTGSIKINNNATYTNAITANLTLTLTDTNSDAAQMRFSNDNATWSNWQSYASSINWTLQNTDGARNVYVQFRDNAGLISAYNTSIILDTTPPTANAGQSQTVTQGNSVTLNGANSADATGIVSYLWDFGDGSQASGATTAHTYASAGTFTAKLTVQDAAGNTAAATVNIIVQPQPTPTPTPAPTAAPTTTTSPTPTPTPTPNLSTITAMRDDGTTINLSIGGNITASQISNAAIHADQSASTTTLSFTVTGQSGTTGYGNITIPKSQVPNGTPTIYIDNQKIDDQGYSQDASNFYVWYTTHFSTRQVSIVFSRSPLSPDYLLPLLLAVAVLLFCVAFIVVLLRKRGKQKN